MGQNCHLSLVSLNPSQSFNFSPWSSDESVGFHIISHPLQLDGCITSIANRRKDITEVQLSHGWVPFIMHRAWVPATALNHGRVQFYCYLSSISRGAAAGLSSQLYIIFDPPPQTPVPYARGFFFFDFRSFMCRIIESSRDCGAQEGAARKFVLRCDGPRFRSSDFRFGTHLDRAT